MFRVKPLFFDYPLARFVYRLCGLFVRGAVCLSVARLACPFARFDYRSRGFKTIKKAAVVNGFPVCNWLPLLPKAL